MTAVPDWESDPIAVICAPVSAMLVTRISPWYSVQSATAEPGMVCRPQTTGRIASTRLLSAMKMRRGQAART